MVELPERLWIEFSWIQIVPTSRREASGRKKYDGSIDTELTAYCDIKLGNALTIHGWTIHTDPSHMDQSWGRFTQNPSGSNCRFLDNPLMHKVDKGFSERELLETKTAEPIWEYCTKVNPDQVRAFIACETEVFNCPEFMPESWGGKSLAIPIDYIELSNIGRDSGDIGFANVNLGGHLIYWNELIYDPRQKPNRMLRTSSIHDQRLVDIINAAILAPENEMQLEEAFSRDYTRIPSREILAACVAGVNPELIPPPPVEFH